MKSREPYISITTLPHEAHCGIASLGAAVVIHLYTRYSCDTEKCAVEMAGLHVLGKFSFLG